MFYLLEFRDRVKNIYQKFDVYFNVLFKFVFSLILFLSINSGMGFDTRLTSPLVSILLALVGAFVPVSVLTFLSLAMCGAHLLQVSYICCAVLVIIYLILWLFILRYSSKYGYAFLATIVLFHMGMQYFIPLLLGIVATPVASIAVVGGTIIYYLLKVCVAVKTGSTSVNPDEILQLFRYVINSFITNKEMYFSAIALAVVCVLVYFIRKRKMDYCNEIAICAGVVLNIVLFLLGKLALDLEYSVPMLIIWSVVSGVVVFAVSCFTRVLDYSGVENVQFEDDDYFYYVKAVPKVKVTASHNKVKNITEMSNEEFEKDQMIEPDLADVDEDLKRMVNLSEEDDEEYADYDKVDDFNLR